MFDDIKIPSFFILFLTFFLIWLYHFKKQQKQYQSQKDAFWERERQAKETRKQEIAAEFFFHPQIQGLCFPALELEATQKQRYLKLSEQIKASADLPMLNFSDLSNTELNLRFGVANQSFITQAEENYHAFIGFLFEYAKFMKSSGHTDEAILALEELIRLKSEKSQHYLLLAEIYQEQKNHSGIERLKLLAEGLEPISQHKFLTALEGIVTTSRD